MAALEAVMGPLYLTAPVARLVGLHRVRQQVSLLLPSSDFGLMPWRRTDQTGAGKSSGADERK
jgi:hypothetical protein